MGGNLQAVKQTTSAAEVKFRIAFGDEAAPQLLVDFLKANGTTALLVRALP